MEDKNWEFVLLLCWYVMVLCLRVGISLYILMYMSKNSIHFWAKVGLDTLRIYLSHGSVLI